MRSSYVIAFVLAATLSAGAPTGPDKQLDRRVSTLGNLEPLKNSGPLNKVSNLAGTFSSSSPSKVLPKSEFGRDLALNELLPEIDGYQNKDEGLVEPIPAVNGGTLVSGDRFSEGSTESEPADETEASSGPTKLEPLVDDLFVALSSNSLGRRVIKRGRDFVMEEPVFNGHQWSGAEELTDESDEPFW